MNKHHYEYDTIVIGGGPAGATTATILAQKSRRVLLLERESFPRYHVGESLMPYTWYPFKRLGVLNWLKQSACPQKHSVQFVSINGKASKPFYFYETIKHECAMTWQVLRSEFDEMMLKNARQKGVEIRHGVAVRELTTQGGRATGVRADIKGSGSETFRARSIVDATGRETLLANKFKWKNRDPKLGKMSIFAYFKGAIRDPGIDEGATTVAYVPEKGWFWYIPLPNNVVSVGIVAEHGYLYRESRNPQEIFNREANHCQWIQKHISNASQMGPVRVTGEFSYRSNKIGGDGFCLVGDAYSFLDPIFSSGVLLALKSGELAADAIDRGLQTGNVTSKTFDNYEKDMRHALDTFRKLVLAFYNQTFSFGEFVNTYPDLNPLLVDALVGNVFKDLNPLFVALEDFSQRQSSSNLSTTPIDP